MASKTKKPDPKKLARVLDKARKHANRTGSTNRIERLTKGIQGNKKYTVKVIDSALKQSSYKSIGSILKRRGDKIGAILTDTAQDIRTTHKLEYLRRWGGGNPIKKPQPKPVAKSKARKLPRRANHAGGRTIATESLKANLHKANPAKLKTPQPTSILKTLGRKALSVLPAVGVGVLAYDVATSGAHTAKQVNRNLANNKKANAARRARAKAGKGSLFQRALDFDAVEYFSGAYSDKPKKTGGKVRSVQAELASSKAKSTKSKTKSTKRKTTSAKPKRAGAKIKVTRGGKTFYRKNPHYGK